MNNEKEVRDFYNEEAEYEKSISVTKDLINNIIKYNETKIQDKLKFLQEEKDFEEYVDLLTAVIGKKTNKYYYCEDSEDVKYYGLEIGKVYRMNELNADIQSKNSSEKQLNLQARAILAEKLLAMTEELKKIFSANIQNGDGSLATIDTFIITPEDVQYLENLIKYLDIMIDRTGRLKILVAERDVYAYANAKADYNKKSSIEKWFYKAFNKEKSIIEGMAKSNKEKR